MKKTVEPRRTTLSFAPPWEPHISYNLYIFEKSNCRYLRKNGIRIYLGKRDHWSMKRGKLCEVDLRGFYSSPRSIMVVYIKGVTTGWTRRTSQRIEKVIQNFGGKTCWQLTTWEIDRWKDNVKIHFKETDFQNMNWLRIRFSDGLCVWGAEYSGYNSKEL
jgi:hypothetical protein